VLTLRCPCQPALDRGVWLKDGEGCDLKIVQSDEVAVGGWCWVESCGTRTPEWPRWRAIASDHEPSACLLDPCLKLDRGATHP
jgi:hypothetical protein